MHFHHRVFFLWQPVFLSTRDALLPLRPSLPTPLHPPTERCAVPAALASCSPIRSVTLAKSWQRVEGGYWCLFEYPRPNFVPDVAAVLGEETEKHPPLCRLNLAHAAHRGCQGMNHCWPACLPAPARTIFLTGSGRHCASLRDEHRKRALQGRRPQQTANALPAPIIVMV